MGWLSSAVSWLAGSTIDRLVAVKLAEALPGAGGIDSDESLYRRLTGSAGRDLTPVTHARQQQIAHYLARTNPFARWLLNTTRDFVCGEGVTVKAADPAIQQVLTACWDDPINRMALKWPEKVRELGLFGEQCWPVFVNQSTGLMRLGYIDPSCIKEVVHDPDNAEEAIGVIMKDTTEQPGKKLRILKGGEDEDLFASTALRLRMEEFIDGDCFFYAINKASAGETRGISDLFALADWLDGYEQLIWNTLDRTGFINAFCWDVTLEDFTEPQIADWKRKNPPPKPGSLFAHNQKVKMQAVTPDLQSEDSERHARIFRNHILGASGFPEHWYGGGGDVNRATAAEMGTPTYKALQSRQLVTRYILQDILTMQVREAQTRRSELRRVEDVSFEIMMPRLSILDLVKAATALKDIAAAAIVAQDRQWIDPEQAARLFAAAAALVGVDLPAEQMDEDADDDRRVTAEYRGR
jgi:hypothetical protein